MVKRFHISFLLLLLSGILAYLATGPGPASRAVFDYRLSRLVLALSTGASLALAGVLLQCLFRNPLAEPFVLGVSSGASTGLLLASLLLHIFSPWLLSLFAFFSALLTVLLVYALYRSLSRPSLEVLLLIGVAFASLLNAINSVITIVFSRNPMYDLFFWMLGSFAAATWTSALLTGAVSITGMIAALFLANRMDLLVLGEEMAEAMGADVARLSFMLVVLSSLLTSLSVAFCGIIGFVGLISPHIVRRLRGGRHAGLIPASMLTGAAIMVWADLLARNLLPPRELPVGVISALAGAPLFLYLAVKVRR